MSYNIVESKGNLIEYDLRIESLEKERDAYKKELDRKKEKIRTLKDSLKFCDVSQNMAVSHNNDFLGQIQEKTEDIIYLEKLLTSSIFKQDSGVKDWKSTKFELEQTIVRLKKTIGELKKTIDRSISDNNMLIKAIDESF